MSQFHPELRRAAALIPPISFGPTLARLAVAAQHWSGTPRPPLVEGVSIRDELITASDGVSIRVRTYVPTADPRTRPAMLWIHGGGMILGTPEQDQVQNIELCRKLGLVIAAVDYRVSPACTYPIPLEDCYAALAWLHSQAGQLNLSPGRIAVGGASAGGGLAAGLAQLAHDRQEYAVAFQLLIYPMLDDRTTLRTDIDEKKLRLWTTKSNRFGWSSYLGGNPGRDDIPEYAAPARRRDLSRLPPAWIGVGTCDLFHDEDVDYAQRLKAAGVSCTLEVVEGAFHGFDVVGPKTDVVRRFRQCYTNQLLSALSG